MPKHQSIHAIRQEAVVSISLTELTANWRCAASLADKEGMTGTAERLRNDANEFERLALAAIALPLDSPHKALFRIEVMGK